MGGLRRMQLQGREAMSRDQGGLGHAGALGEDLHEVVRIPRLRVRWPPKAPKLGPPPVQLFGYLRAMDQEHRPRGDGVVVGVLDHYERETRLMEDHHLPGQFQHARIKRDEAIDSATRLQLLEHLPILVVPDQVRVNAAKGDELETREKRGQWNAGARRGNHGRGRKAGGAPPSSMPPADSGEAGVPTRSHSERLPG